MIWLYLREIEGKQSEAAHDLLWQVLWEKYQIPRQPLKLGQDGKPYLEEGPCFNLSHSRGYAAVAVSDKPVGVDLEVVRNYMERLPTRIFSPKELKWFERRGETKKDFFTLWTLKESYYKYLGTGLRGFPNGTEFVLTDRWRLEGETCWFHVMEEKSLLIALCSDEQQEIKVQWV